MNLAAATANSSTQQVVPLPSAPTTSSSTSSNAPTVLVPPTTGSLMLEWLSGPGQPSTNTPSAPVESEIERRFFKGEFFFVFMFCMKFYTVFNVIGCITTSLLFGIVPELIYGLSKVVDIFFTLTSLWLPRTQPVFRSLLSYLQLAERTQIVADRTPDCR